MNTKLNSLALGVSAIALLVAAAGSIFTIVSAPEMEPVTVARVQGDLLRSAEAIRKCKNAGVFDEI